MKFFRRTAEYPFLTTKGVKKFRKGWEYSHLTGNDEYTNKTVTTCNKNEQQQYAKNYCDLSTTRTKTTWGTIEKNY